MIRYDKRYRARHIHNCTKIQKAKERLQKLSSLEYCYECTEWHVQGLDWDQHCRQHLSVLPISCSSIIYCHTLIKPANCPFHLAATDLPASERLQSWDRDADALRHIEDEHLRDANWPLACPLGCEEVSKDEQSFKYHLSDYHGYSLSSETHKRKWQDDDMAQVKKQMVEGYTTDCKLPTLEILTVKTERGADPTLPILVDSDDSTEPLAIFKAAPTLTHTDLYPSPRETPPFSRGMSLCSTVDEDFERLRAQNGESTNPDLVEEDCFIADWVDLPPSPTLDSGTESPVLETADSAWLVIDRINLPPPPTPFSKDKDPGLFFSLDTEVKRESYHVLDGNDAGSDSASNHAKTPKKPLIRLNYNRPTKPNYSRPRIVLRCSENTKSGLQAGQRPGKRKKRRMNA